MKTKKIFYVSLICAILYSCAPASFFQVYKTVPSENIRVESNSLVYEDENCIVSYNFWGVGGDVGFQIHNKTAENIYLNLDESYFILNGFAFDYYKNRVFSQSISTGRSESRSASASSTESGTNLRGLPQTNRATLGASVGVISTSDYSVSFHETKTIVIPPNTSRIITEYKINETRIRDCELYKYPAKNQINSINYTRDNSPVVFANRISYSVGNQQESIRFENEFYISEITNYPESEIMDSRFEEYCGQRSTIRTNVFKDVSPDKFYIRYTRGNDTRRH